MYNFLTLDKADLNNKRVLLRVDFNVPLEYGVVTDTTRIERVLPTIKYLLGKKATIVIASHLGRPNGPDPKLSLKPVARELAKLLGQEVTFVDNINVPLRGNEKIYMLENLRFDDGEESNSEEFAAKLSKLADIYVNDGFAISHRTHASTCAITKLLPSYAGLLMQEELESLSAALTDPVKPVVAIVGGSKISTKLGVLNNLVKKVDYLIPSGGIANTFLLESGFAIGSSLAEPSLINEIILIRQQADKYGCKIILPIDVMVSTNPEDKNHIKTIVLEKDDIANNEKIFDVGPQSIELYNKLLDKCKTLVWNGPLGVYENPPFDEGTVQVGEHVAKLCTSGKLYAVVGGGETIAALNQKRLLNKISYVSTAGGAFLEWLEGIELPGVKALEVA